MVAIVVCLLLATALPARGQERGQVGKMAGGIQAMPGITLNVGTPGLDGYVDWKYEFNETDPTVVEFRATTKNTKVGLARWQVLANPNDPASVLAEGQAGTLQAGKYIGFTVDFRPIVGSNERRPVSRWVRVVGYEIVRQGGRPAEAARSNLVRVDFVGAGEPTVFTDLPVSIYEEDYDHDGLTDLKEYYLAEQFKPAFVFDSDEGNRRPNEPVVLFQVRPEGCMGSQCPKPLRAWIKYVLLFAEDGGYGPSSDCFDEHNGDNQAVDIKIESADGQTWSLVQIFNSHEDFVWPGYSVEFWYDQLGRQDHPVIYLSAHKHHQYFDTSNDEKDSVYSDWGCNDDVNGKGIRMFANILSPGNRPNNVGEPEAHDPARFVSELTAYGYPGENAWSDKPFKGGLGDDGGETTPMACMWAGWNPVPGFCED